MTLEEFIRQFTKHTNVFKLFVAYNADQHTNCLVSPTGDILESDQLKIHAFTLKDDTILSPDFKLDNYTPSLQASIAKDAHARELGYMVLRQVEEFKRDSPSYSQRDSVELARAVLLSRVLYDRLKRLFT